MRGSTWRYSIRSPPVAILRIAGNMNSFFQLYWRPGVAMGAILDRGSLLFASAACLIVGMLSPFAIGFFVPLLVLAAVYVPGVLLLAGLFSRGGTSFQRDYSPLLACAAMGWSAANLVLVAA